MRTWLKNLRIDILPGLAISGFVVLLRLLGTLQSLEWRALDLSLRWRPAETTDPRITIVTITEEDIQTTIDHPISDRALAELIQTLQTYQPRVVGIDIFRDRPVGEGFPELKATLEAFSNVIGINKISDTPVSPPPMLPEAQVGFADAILDGDGFLRRSFLAGADAEDNYRFSLTIRMVEQYVASDGLILENGQRDPETMRFGETEIPRFQPNTGGYVRTDNGGNQALINFRAGRKPFTRITYQQFTSGQFDPELLKNRAVLVGYTADSVKDFVSSAAIAGNDGPSLIPGVELQAHTISQILSSIYDDRPFLKVSPDWLEYIIIVSAGLLGMTLAQWQRKPARALLAIVLFGAAWLALCYILLVASWWLPLVPTLAAFLLNAVALYPFYQAQAQLRSQLDERQVLIDWAYNTIHNGPLQILSVMLSTWPEDQPAPVTMRSELKNLNQELRGVYETMRQEMLMPAEQLVLMGQRTINLDIPLDELLHETYMSTLERHQQFFVPILKIISFKPMREEHLTTDQKRALGRFLEESLLNVYKYAKGTTRLTITCLWDGQHNVIRVIDNGKGLEANFATPKGGYGSRQGQKLARSLGGEFIRSSVDPQGVCCELSWPAQITGWKRWFKAL